MFDNIKSDLGRLSSSGNLSARTLIAGLLSQGFQALLIYRLFNWLYCKGLPGQPLRFFCERFIEITTGISIPAQCQIGRGLRIHHFGGIIFHPTTVIGEHCTLYHGVTIGDRGGSGGAARIGHNVLIGAGAKIIGEITIGDNCIIGANTVVAKDIPAGHVATGSPCKLRALPPEQFVEQDSALSHSSVPRVMDLRGTYKGGGGPDKTVLNSAAQHDPHQVHILVTYLRQPDDSEFQIPEMASRLGINYIDLYDKKGIDLQCLKKLRGLLKEHKLSLVHAHDDKTLLYGWLLKLAMPRLRTMYTCHSHAVHQRHEFSGSLSYFKFKLRQKIQIFLMKRYPKPIITISNDTKKRLIANGLRDQDVTVLHNGIDIDHWSRERGNPILRKEFGLGPDDLLVGTVARITYEKDLPTFFRVSAAVSKEVPNVTFVIVGDGYGAELDNAKAEVRHLGLEDVVKFTGHRNDLLDVYVSFDLFLMTSLTEGLPNTMLEAMALGVPVVSTDVGGVSEVLEEGRSGLLAEAGDHNALSRMVQDLLTTPDSREALGMGARARIEESFAFEKRVRMMENYYQKLSERNAAGFQ